MPHFRETAVETNGVRLHCVAAGHGPLILFLHGFPEFWYEWKQQLLSFSADRLAVAPDLRGYNLSDKPASPEAYRRRVLVEDIRGIADHYRDGRRLVLVGHDWGGVLAWAFAMTCPRYLDGLIIINAPHPVIFSRLLASDPEQQRASEYMLMFRSARAEEILARDDYAALRGQLLAPLLNSGTFTREDEAAYLAAWSQPGALTGALNYYRASRLAPGTAPAAGEIAPDPARSRVTVPTLVIWGEQDSALSVHNLEGLEEFVPQLTVRRIPDGSHWVVHEKPDEISRYIREFIGTMSAP